VERERRRTDPAYAMTIKLLGNGSLKNPDKVEEYVNTYHQHRATIFEKHIKYDNRRARFNRKRANQREFANIGKHVAHQAAIKELYSRKHKMKPRRWFRRARRNIMDAEKKKISFVGFGRPTFGHGKWGPTPRKKTIKAIARRVAVLLVNEWRTSKLCHACFEEMKSTNVYRQRKCANTETPHTCDRDINGAMNMAMIALFLLIYGARPLHLTWPKLLDRLSPSLIEILNAAVA